MSYNIYMHSKLKILVAVLAVIILSSYGYYRVYLKTHYSFEMKEEILNTDFVSAEINYPVISGLKDINIQNKINQKIEETVRKTYSSFRDEEKPNCESYEGYTGECVININVDSSVSKLSSKYLSISFTNYQFYPGSAHPIHYLVSLNFDLDTGEELKLSDFFVQNSNYLNILSEKLRKSLAEKLSMEMSDSMLLDGTKPDGQHFQNFVLSDEGFVFVFGDYEVAPYAAGNPTVLISYGELSSLLKPAFQLHTKTFTLKK